MATTRLADIVEPAEFTNYTVLQTMERAPLVQAGVMRRNGVIDTQLQAGAHSFNVPSWNDLSGDPDIVNDNPSDMSTPHDITAFNQVVRKAFLHNSWSAMNLASEISGDNAVQAVRDRTTAYWQRQMQTRLIASLNGLYAANVANNSGDMVNDISGKSGNAANFSASAVIDTASTLGDALNTLTGIAMHSDIYSEALKQDLIQFVPDSQGGQIATYRGLAVVVDDNLPTGTGTYTTVLFGGGAFGYGIAAPRVADGTEIENIPSAGNGGGQEVLHSRVNLAIHPAGYSWTETTVAGESPDTTELADATNWSRKVSRKHVPIAFLKSKIG